MSKKLFANFQAPMSALDRNGEIFPFVFHLDSAVEVAKDAAERYFLPVCARGFYFIASNNERTLVMISRMRSSFLQMSVASFSGGRC